MHTGQQVSSSKLARRATPLATCVIAALALTSTAMARPHNQPAAPVSLEKLRARANTSHTISLAMLDRVLAKYQSALNSNLPVRGHSSLAYPSPVGHTTRKVTDCTDGPKGSDAGDLRDTIAASATGDTVDLTTLTCTNSTITLTQGAIGIDVDDLILEGPGADKLAIDGGASTGHYNEVFYHEGVGTFRIEDLTITDAKYISDILAYGGCIYSTGTVTLADSALTNCRLFGTGPETKPNDAFGAGVYALGNVNAKYSTISGNVVFSYYGHAVGGGIFAKEGTIMKYSTIANNTAGTAAAARYSYGAGIFAAGSGNVTIQSTTISGNFAGKWAGACFLFNGDASSTASIINSTISSNETSGVIAGALIGLPLTMSNTTIASNVATYASQFGAGLYLEANSDIQSSVIALNVENGIDRDLSARPGVTITGANNLIEAPTVTVPAGTLNSCPKLAPLADNGGFVFTNALLITSPAIDAGNNNQTLATDTRGTSFDRVVGTNADIGAYERQAGAKDDLVFNGEFESRCR
jgi:hypothetical protein